jgi:hypothetical protein
MDDLSAVDHLALQRRIEDKTLIFGAYGKFSSARQFDVVADVFQRFSNTWSGALLIIASSGLNAEMTLRSISKSNGLASNRLLLSLIPPWRVPEFISLCDVIFYLHSGHRVAMHSPIIPLEVLASGRLLIVSEEIATSEKYRRRLVDHWNCRIVPNFADAEHIFQITASTIQDSDLRSKIAQRANNTFHEFPPFEAFVSGWEAVFAAACDR